VWIIRVVKAIVTPLRVQIPPLQLKFYRKENMMKLKQAIEFAEACGLETLGESVYNIDLHSTNIFVYDEIGKELTELYTDYKAYCNKYGYDKNTKIINFKDDET
jgi:hypothetical protein